MFPTNYFPQRYFTARYWPPGLVVVVAGLVRKAFFTLFIAKKKEFTVEL